MTKILAIEDEPAILENILETLQLGDFDVVGAENGTIGLALAKRLKPDLIVCDIMMPTMNGYQVLVEVRSDPSIASLPFIFLTAKADKPSRREGMGLGADDYLTKPFVSADLLSSVSACLKKRALLNKQYQQQFGELRETVLHMLSHELRTPLSAVLGFSEMLTTQAESLNATEVAEMATYINNSGLYLLKIVDRFLSYAEVEAARHDPAWREQRLQSVTNTPGSIIKDVAILQATTAERQSDLHLKLAEECAIRISSAHLQKIAAELIENAFKFSSRSTPVTVSARAEGSSYVLAIENAGRGMKPEEISQIGVYMQFQRNKHEQPGMGLGLALVKDLIELYGGKLLIESVPDRYLVARVSLPFG